MFRTIDVAAGDTVTLCLSYAEILSAKPVKVSLGW
jgi:hypothetical protein